MDKLLTVIIPFLNEGTEVENTLKSIRFHSNSNIEIIIINDASTDDVDYKSVADKYSAMYIVNETRLGVAASRDKGVNICSTPYFLLLDAHMRFYDNKWVNRIVRQLNRDDRALLCCQTKILNIENGLVVETINPGASYGAYIEFYNTPYLFAASWTGIKYKSNTKTYPIACVLGAGYACSKRYWSYLRGLEGLIYYGLDEPYISLKVWLEGGKCLLLDDVVIGHIYRTKPPYHVENFHTSYNQLLIAKLLLPPSLSERLFAKAKYQSLPIYNEVLYSFMEKAVQISDLKSYYKKILKNDYHQFILFNNSIYLNKNEVKDKDGILKRIAQALLLSGYAIKDFGLLDGRMSVIVFLFHYARYARKRLYRELAQTLLDDLLETLHISQSIWFETGLSGIGWSIEYLYQQNFIKGDTNEILEDFDNKIMEINPLYVQDLSLRYGLGGIAHYILARLYTVNKEDKQNPFYEFFLNSLYSRIISVIENREDSDSIDIFIKFIDYYKVEKKIIKPSLYDVSFLREEIHDKNYTPGLIGSAGIGLYLMLYHDSL